MATPQEQQAQGLWKRFTGKLQETWGALSGDNLDRFEGQKDQLVGHIQQKTGESREEIQRRLDEASRDSEYKW